MLNWFKYKNLKLNWALGRIKNLTGFFISYWRQVTAIIHLASPAHLSILNYLFYFNSIFKFA